MRTTKPTKPQERRMKKVGLSALCIALMVAASATVVAQEPIEIENVTIPVTVRVIPVPVGAIVAFNNSCPADGYWEPYVQAEGRFLVGAGIVREADITIRPGEGSDKAVHSHRGKTNWPSGHSIKKDDDCCDVEVPGVRHEHVIRPDVHLPPFVGVVFCILK